MRAITSHPDRRHWNGGSSCVKADSLRRRVGVLEECSWSSSDSDYDDLDAMMGDLSGPCLEEMSEMDEDATSVATTGSNTPSVVGENLESFSLSDSEKCVVSRPGPQRGGPLAPLSKSLFPFVPPSLHFYPHKRVPASPLPLKLRMLLKWKLSNVTPAVVKRILCNSGFRLLRKNTALTDWTGTWGNHMKSHLFRNLPSNGTKINHFPGTFTIGRKDTPMEKLPSTQTQVWEGRLQLSTSNVLPAGRGKLLRRIWLKRGGKERWIVKPPALSRGNGIRVVSRWTDIPKSRPLVVQKYISRPHLINDTKYDLRIYVLIYLFEDGLVRFASKKYDADLETLGDAYKHLTNYSINKNSSSYLPNEEAGRDRVIRTGLDSEGLWERIKDLVIKTFLSAEDQMLKRLRGNVSSHYTTYELFGFDVLLDARLKPWLIEVNISPSLHSASPLDLHIKSALAAELFNIEDEVLCYNKRLYAKEISKADKAKQDAILGSLTVTENGLLSRESYLEPILEKLTPDDVRWLIRSEDELHMTHKFERIFPTKDTHSYFRFFDVTRYYNLLLDAWEYKYAGDRSAGNERLIGLCKEKVHLKVPTTPSALSSKKKMTMSHESIVNVDMLKAPTSEPNSTDSAIQSENEKSRSPSPILKTAINGNNECLSSSNDNNNQKHLNSSNLLIT
ncbi:Tubulin polyglutamylase TTLL4 [Caligus rogercresseyi]|uniref:Tubulin polyglutamylase TTLL4 n=1 Tax=Caligus rogercresseyi TaxID=217165 RepID=A0A7T8K8U9_CALRO|nr:Tubulin polyglutamylase TTLL4 [Caligus rogercresseyi]